MYECFTYVDSHMKIKVWVREVALSCWYLRGQESWNMLMDWRTDPQFPFNSLQSAKDLISVNSALVACERQRQPAAVKARQADVVPRAPASAESLCDGAESLLFSDWLSIASTAGAGQRWCRVGELLEDTAQTQKSQKSTKEWLSLRHWPIMGLQQGTSWHWMCFLNPALMTWFKAQSNLVSGLHTCVATCKTPWHAFHHAWITKIAWLKYRVWCILRW